MQNDIKNSIIKDIMREIRENQDYLENLKDEDYYIKNYKGGK